MQICYLINSLVNFLTIMRFSDDKQKIDDIIVAMM